MPAAAPNANRGMIVSVVAIAFVAFNVLFYVMSASYVDSHRAMSGAMPGGAVADSADLLGHLRLSFAIFSTLVAGGLVAAEYAPRQVGHAVPVVLGLVHLVGAKSAFMRDAPAVVTVVLLASGVLMPLLARSSLRGSRSAWAFLVALCGVCGVVELFASPKIRAAVDVGLWTTMILPGLSLVAVWALASLHRSYVERDAAA